MEIWREGQSCAILLNEKLCGSKGELQEQREREEIFVVKRKSFGLLFQVLFHKKKFPSHVELESRN